MSVNLCGTVEALSSGLDDMSHPLVMPFPRENVLTLMVAIFKTLPLERAINRTPTISGDRDFENPREIPCRAAVVRPSGSGTEGGA